MVICPWCGTNYLAFQPNCKNCGGPITAHEEPETPPEQSESDQIVEIIFRGPRFPAPPPPPRTISDNYIWKMVFSDGWAISGLVFAVMGAVFMPVGLALILTLVAFVVGIPFIGLGLLFLLGGLGILIWRYQAAHQTVQTLRNGQAVEGKILDVRVNAQVTVNGRNPWIITYAFEENGQEFQGKVTTLNMPGWHLRPGYPTWVLHMPGRPDLNALYPHP